MGSRPRCVAQAALVGCGHSIWACCGQGGEALGKQGDRWFELRILTTGGWGGGTAPLAGFCPHPDQRPAPPPAALSQVLIPAGALDAIPATSGGLDPPSAPTVTAASGPSPAEPQASPLPAPAASPVPAPAVEQPSPAPVLASPAPAPSSDAPAQGTLTGVALASGYLVGCNVQLVDSAGTSQVRPAGIASSQHVLVGGFVGEVFFCGGGKGPCPSQCTRGFCFPAVVMSCPIRLHKF